ncbi:hypothetical protein BKA93DRAFT_750072 [Sparassis latifolia]
MGTIRWFMAGTAGCTSEHTETALLWMHTPHTSDMAWCIGDAVTGCISDAVSFRVMALAWCTLGVGSMAGASSWVCASGIVGVVWCISDAVGIGSAGCIRVSVPAWHALSAGGVPGMMSTSCTAAAVSFVAQLQCVGVLGATCAVGQLVAQTARRIGIGLSWACALHAGDVAGASSASCAEAAVGAVMQPRCIAVLGCIGTALLWLHAPGTGDMAGTSSMSCVTAVMRMLTLPCHVEHCMGNVGSPAFCKGIKVAVSTLDGGKAIFASIVLVKGGEVEVLLDQPVGDCEPMSEVVHLNPSSQCVGNTAYVTDDDRDFRGPERCCQIVSAPVHPASSIQS